MPKFWRIFGSFFGVVLILLTTPAVAYGQNYSPDFSLTVSAVVQPHIYIVIDQSNNIQQIFSNSNVDVYPTVVLGDINGPQLPMTTYISEEYQTLRHQITIKYGQIYQIPSHWQTAIKASSHLSILFRSMSIFRF